MRRLLRNVLVALFLLGIAWPASAITFYSVVQLDDFGNTTLARDLNARGEVVGIASGFEGDTPFRAVRWMPDGAIQDLGLGANSDATAINDNGQVTGNFDGNAFGREAYLLDGNNVTALGALGGTQSGGVDIDSNGQVVGFAQTEFGNFRAVTSRNGGAFQDLGSIAPVEPLGGAEAVAEGVNDRGQIVGFAHVGGRTGFCNVTRDCHAFIHENGRMQDLTGLGLTLGGDESAALAINDDGAVVGWATNADGDERAFLFEGGVTIDLGALEGATESTAWDINADGTIVGHYEPALTAGRAFVYMDGQMHNLNDLIDPNDPLFASMNLVEARGINDRGQIIANGIGNGGIRSFLLTPIEPQGAVPEPTSALLYGVGLSVVGLRLRTRGRR